MRGRRSRVRSDRGLDLRGRLDRSRTPPWRRRGRHSRHTAGATRSRAGRRRRGRRRAGVGRGTHPSGHLSRRPDRVPGAHRAGGRVDRPSPERDGGGAARAWDRETRSRSAGARRRTWSSLAEVRRHGPAPGPEEDATMAERDLDEALRRMSQTKVNRRGFLAAAGLRRHGRLPGRMHGQQRAARPPAASTAPSRPPRAAAAPAAAPAAQLRAGVRAPHLQLVRVRVREEQAEFTARNGVAYSEDIFSNNEELVAKLAARRQPGLRHRCPTGEYVPGMIEAGYLEKLDMSRIPNFQYINADVQEHCLGPEQRVHHPQGLRDDRDHVPHEARPRAGDLVARVLRPREGQVFGQGRRRRFDGRCVPVPAQDARLLGQRQRSGASQGGAATSCSIWPRTCSPSTRRTTTTSSGPRRRHWRSAGRAAE